MVPGSGDLFPPPEPAGEFPQVSTAVAVGLLSNRPARAKTAGSAARKRLILKDLAGADGRTRTGDLLDDPNDDG